MCCQFSTMGAYCDFYLVCNKCLSTLFFWFITELLRNGRKIIYLTLQQEIGAGIGVVRWQTVVETLGTSPRAGGGINVCFVPFGDWDPGNETDHQEPLYVAGHLIFCLVGCGKGWLREMGGSSSRTGVVRWRLTLKTIILPTTLGKGHLFKDSLKRVYEAKKRHRVLKWGSYKLTASSKQVNLDP